MKKAVVDLHNVKKSSKSNINIPSVPFSNGFKPIKTLKNTPEKKVFEISNGKETRIGKVMLLYNVGNDVDVFEKLSKYNLAPVIYKTDVYIDEKENDMIYVEMERLDGTIYQLLKTQLNKKELDVILKLINELLLRLNKFKFSHGDFHWENIGFLYDEKKDCVFLKMIDFEFADNKSDFRKEVLQLIRTLDKKYTPLIDESNRVYIRNRLEEYYKKNFGEIKDIEKEYKDL
jgi:hypothetical protein